MYFREKLEDAVEGGQGGLLIEPALGFGFGAAPEAFLGAGFFAQKGECCEGIERQWIGFLLGACVECAPTITEPCAQDGAFGEATVGALGQQKLHDAIFDACGGCDFVSFFGFFGFFSSDGFFCIDCAARSDYSLGRGRRERRC